MSLNLAAVNRFRKAYPEMAGLSDEVILKYLRVQNNARKALNRSIERSIKKYEKEGRV